MGHIPTIVGYPNSFQYTYKNILIITHITVSRVMPRKYLFHATISLSMIQFIVIDWFVVGLRPLVGSLVEPGLAGECPPWGSF